MFLDESPISLDLWLRSLGLSSISSLEAPYSSEEIIVPPFDSEYRRSSARFSKAAIILTLLGTNGSLGMPYAFERCGVALTILLVTALAVVTDQTMYLFWSSARKTGANTYGGVVRSSFGYRMHAVMSAFLFIYLLLMVSQNMRSVHNILTRLLQNVLPHASLTLMIVWVPIAVVCSLAFHPLQRMVYIGLCSLFALFAILIVCKSITPSSERSALKVVPDTLTDSVLGFNVLLLHFVGSFNILYIQSELRTPTNPLMVAVVRQGILGTCLLAIAIGFAGYAFLHDQSINDGIPINFLDHEALGKNYPLLQSISFVAIYCSSPLILIPCRDYLLDTIETFVLDGHCPTDMSDCQDDVGTWTTGSSTQSDGNNNNGNNNNHHNKNNRQHTYTNLVPAADEESYLLPSIEENTRCELNMNPYVRYSSIVAILLVAELLGRVNTVVPFLWNLTAPGMTLLFAHIVPAACYLEAHKRETQGYKTFSRCVIVVSILLALACTIAAIRNVI